MTSAAVATSQDSGGLVITEIQDPGHSWLIVPEAVAADIGLNSDHFTQYSYHYGGNFYLEEDADAATFLARYHRQHGTLPLIEAIYIEGDAACRNYPRCTGADPKYEDECHYLAGVL